MNESVDAKALLWLKILRSIAVIFFMLSLIFGLKSANNETGFGFNALNMTVVVTSALIVLITSVAIALIPNLKTPRKNK